MNYIALKDKEALIRDDERELTESDFTFLEENTSVLDRFSEENTSISVLSIASDSSCPKGYHLCSLREIFAEGVEDKTWHYARAKALLSWRSVTHFCGCCASPLEDHSSLTARLCPKCGNLIFPRIEPCIIVLVYRKDIHRILLAKHVQRNQDIYACIAGFMEAGETAEQAVSREIREETGLQVSNIRYFGSQSWPFPAQLMLGFTAEYQSGDLHLQEEEIQDAAWFDPDNCPASPRPGSIAWRLIHEFKF